MSARVLIVKNLTREGPGLLRDVLMQHRVEADVVELERGEPIPELDAYQGLIVLGGTPSANDDTPQMRSQLQRTAEALDAGLPFLGICLGHQVLGRAAGATVTRAAQKEVGFLDANGAQYTVTLTADGRNDPLFEGLPNDIPVFQLHGEMVMPSDDLIVLATSPGCPVQAVRAGRRAYGLQMHVELVPEMLAVWAAQDAELRGFDAVELQKQYASISTSYMAVGRRLLTNFLVSTDLVSAIDLTEQVGESMNAR
jgi:GMP synthase (glutamine-hydrolysing)